MRSWKILDIKILMNHMLCLETFDAFQLLEASITTKMSVVIDGRIPKDYYSRQEAEELGMEGYGCLPYREVRPVCFDIIKGKRLPGNFRFVFLLSRKQTMALLSRYQLEIPIDDIVNIALHVTFQNGELYITTGTTRRTFSMDRRLDEAWGGWVEEFLKKQGIAAEDMLS